ncbi:acyl-CoA synthetase short-chain family member 3 [Dichotomocladium elegans]|nr:acyl-CoA synthetase short-chain family member 3 [Dichotomocladium elegans]
MWTKAAADITWIKQPRAILERSGKEPNPYVWFPGGTLNTCYNCVDRHDPSGIAFIYDSPVTNTKRQYTYGEVRDQVVHFAGVLHDYGVRKGDTVLIYMPMIPEAAFCMLACARLGAVHSVVFGGFAPKELAKRIQDAQPKVLVTASCGIEPKRVIPYKPLVDTACEISTHKVAIKLVVQRPGQVQAELNYNHGDRDYKVEMERIRRDHKAFEACVEVGSQDPLYTLYTSGTTGVPKGVVRPNGGHAVVLLWSMGYVYNIHKGETMFTASDIGWAVGHSYTVYGPLLAGATSIIYEGKPIHTPDAGTFWRVVSDYKAKTMFTAPTAIRAIRREDPEAEHAARYDLKCLHSLFLAGERSDPETLRWCQAVLKHSHIIDHYWSTELGSPVTSSFASHDTVRIKWGAAGMQVPGSIIRVLDEETHQEVSGPNQFGDIVLKLPLPPGAFPTLWKNEKGYTDSYFKKFPGYYDTGDAGMIDEEGFVHIMARTDDIINVAGHRLSTGSIEQIINANHAVVECCVVPLPDKLKGHVPLAVVVLKHGDHSSHAQLTSELVAATRKDLGAIACFEKAVYVQRLPKTRSGKVLRRCIRDMVEGKPLRVPATIEDETVLPEIEDALRLHRLLPTSAKL